MRRVLALAMLLTGACCGQDNNPTAPVQLPFKNVLDFGARGDGIADDTAAINAALDGGGDVYLPAGTYKVSSSLNLSSATTLRGAGWGASTISMMTTGNHVTIDARGSYITIADLAIMGPSPSETYVGNEKAIRVGPAAGKSSAHNIGVRNCAVYNYGYSAVELDSVSGGSVTNNDIHRIGYTAVACLSCADVVVTGNRIDAVTPGTNHNAYGVIFSHWTLQEPACTRCIADHNVINSIPLWEGLDSHDGTFITFSNNVVENCRIGITAGGVAGWNAPCREINIIGNTVAAGRAAGLNSGIVVNGRPGYFADRILISGNIVRGYGLADTVGAIELYQTNSAVVSGNLVGEFFNAGVCFGSDNSDFLCSGNLVDSQDSRDKSAHPYGICVDPPPNIGPNAGSVTGNRLHGFGIYVNPADTARVHLGDNQ